MRIAFYTLGCKVNQYETQVLQQFFRKDGFQLVHPDEVADVYVVNSCTVTASGDKKTRQVLHRFQRQNPNAVLALTGCMPQAFPQQAEELAGAQVITGAYNRKGLLDAVKKAVSTGERVIDITRHERGEVFEEMQADGLMERTRAFVKIQDGCERFCSYCIIPTARGYMRSKPIHKMREEIGALAQKGFLEVVLVGINLSCYGVDIGLSLIDAVEAACQVEGIRRVRLSSLEPELLTLEHIIRLRDQEKFCPHFHLSLQSGCDATLKRMNRHYTAKEYMEIVDNIRAVFDNSAITTDVMVGFPGETREEFSQSMDFVQRVGFAKAHVFAYSRRKGTAADLMPGQAASGIKAERSRQMMALTEKTRDIFLAGQAGRHCQVLVEACEKGWCHGYSENYTPVKIQGEHLEGQIRTVLMESAHEGEMMGQLA